MRPSVRGATVPSRRRRLAGVALLAALLVGTGCTGPAPAPPGRSTPDAGTPAQQPPARWRPCPEVPRELIGRSAEGIAYECATIAVPRDWTAPDGQTYEIALLRARSQAQSRRIGSLVVNPGGPGGSGIDTAVYLSFGPGFGGLSTEVLRRFDIVGFDPRGVGRSTRVDCLTDADLDASFGGPPDPVRPSTFDEVVQLNRRAAEGCGAKYGDQLRHFSTVQTARDLDAVRAAVGDDKLTYLGYSYGTLLGATYAQLFPQRVRALVLDGAVDPTEGLVAGSESQARGFERAFGNFAAWCAATPARCPIAPDARDAVTDALDRAERDPVPGTDGRDATSGWIFYAVISSLYSRQGWAELAEAIADLRGGDPAGVFELADAYAERDEDGNYANLFDANLAVNCADTADRPDVQTVRELQGRWRERYPMFGPALAIGMLPCVFWPAEPDPYPTGPADGAPPILVVGTTGDPATPYENTAELAAMLGVGHVLTWEGEGHTAYPNTACITRAVDAYLINLTVPRAGLRCPPG